MSTTIVSFEIDKSTLEVLDRLARESEKTRSACLREIVAERIQTSQEAGDRSVEGSSVPAERR